jgi:FkbM family methyltransferase
MTDLSLSTTGRRLLRLVLGRPRLEPLFRGMHRVALAGLGYGEGNNPSSSGEAHVLDRVRSRCAPNGPIRVFDVGANVGEYAEQLLACWGDRAELWCFEPSPSTFDLLSTRLSGRPGVNLENLGFSDTEGSLTLYSRGKGSKVASVHGRHSEEWQLDQTEEIRVRTLDSYCAEHGIDCLDFLKLDVEGHELSILRGAKRMLETGSVRYIQFEVSVASIDSRVFFRDFWEMLSGRYRLWRVLAHGLVEVSSYDESQEVFRRATNYLAERR